MERIPLPSPANENTNKKFLDPNTLSTLRGYLASHTPAWTPEQLEEAEEAISAYSQADIVQAINELPENWQENALYYQALLNVSMEKYTPE